MHALRRRIGIHAGDGRRDRRTDATASSGCGVFAVLLDGDDVLITGIGDLAARLLSLHIQLTEVLRAYVPDAAAVENTFVNKDAVATLKLGQARGIALLVPAQFGITVGEYAPNAVKKTVVGVGHAAKAQVDHMVRIHLPGVQIVGADAADALAIAICHAHHLQSAGRLNAALKRAAG